MISTSTEVWIAFTPSFLEEVHVLFMLFVFKKSLKIPKGSS